MYLNRGGGMAFNLFWSDRSAWKFIPFWDALWIDRIFVIIYVRSYMHNFILCLSIISQSLVCLSIFPDSSLQKYNYIFRINI